MGINPKQYRDIPSAERDIAIIPSLIHRQEQILFNAEQGLIDHVHLPDTNKKLTKRQQAKVEWHERVVKQNQKDKENLELLKADTFSIIEYDEWKTIYNR
jgi:hypothetical protein